MRRPILLLTTALLPLLAGIAAAEVPALQPVQITEWKAVYGQVEARDRLPARARLGGARRRRNSSSFSRKSSSGRSPSWVRALARARGRLLPRGWLLPQPRPQVRVGVPPAPLWARAWVPPPAGVQAR